MACHCACVRVNLCREGTVYTESSNMMHENILREEQCLKSHFINSSMLVSLTTYVHLAVASSIDQNGWFSRVVLHKREVLAVPGQVIQTVLYCMPGGLKVARSILDNVVCYGELGSLRPHHK